MRALHSLRDDAVVNGEPVQFLFGSPISTISRIPKEELGTAYAARLPYGTLGSGDKVRGSFSLNFYKNRGARYWEKPASYRYIYEKNYTFSAAEKKKKHYYIL